MATRKILFRGQTRHKGEKTSISGKPLPGIWVTGGIFPQNKGYERAIIYTQDPKVEKHVVYAETVGQYTGVDDVLETPVFEDDIITFWQRTDTKHILSNHPCSEACELFYNGIEWKCYPDDTELNDVIAHPEQYIVIPVLFSDK